MFNIRNRLSEEEFTVNFAGPYKKQTKKKMGPSTKNPDMDGPGRGELNKHTALRYNHYEYGREELWNTSLYHG